jgi:hypothetical protein
MDRRDDFKKMIVDATDVAFNEMNASANDMAEVLIEVVWKEMESCFDTKEETFERLARILYSVSLSSAKS